MREAVVGMELTDIQKVLGPGQPGFRARQVYEAVYQHRAAGFDRILTLPKMLRERIAGEFDYGLPRLAARYDSTDGTR